jgi:hypothetical protein
MARCSSDTRHVNDRWLLDPARQLGQALSERVVADSDGIGPAHISVLRHHVGNGEMVLHLDELDHAQLEILTGACPPAVRGFRPGPARLIASTKPFPQPPESLHTWAMTPGASSSGAVASPMR